ncbi:DUF4174 domain-containing protein [Robertkochia marina]|uniref:DUF4174 domain-containing protein n=1 Tax=Robertkochia marina TaxID=1227945 RepID=A0A4S3LXQ8_9FLAO|nr:DUF4174 domain-containing protein [Robertkochia marina]THD66350.1 DUF4174 domain-containing protein [Robertkochia marina]TRZ44032.1 DUF4174 domain-containing protein [Robertkochia marina]
MVISLWILLFSLGSIPQIEPKDFTWKNRLLIIADPKAETPENSAVHTEFMKRSSENQERDLLIIFISDNSIWLQNNFQNAKVSLWREHFQLSLDFTGVVLVGKDGGKKLTTEGLITPREVYDLIDSMPMRQMEMKQKN